MHNTNIIYTYFLGRNHGKGFGDEYKDEYLAVGDFNVFSIDWGDLESWTNYFHAAAITKPVAQYSAQLGIIVNNNYDAQQAFTFFKVKLTE